jgi:chitodextrinase
MDRGKVILVLVLMLTVSLVVPLTIKGQQPSVFRVEKLPFNTPAFSEISPVISRNGLIYCSDKRFSIIKDRISYDGRRLYNIYFSEKEDSSGWSKPAEVKSDLNRMFNSGPLNISPDGRTVYFTSEIETGSAAKRKSFRNHSGIFIGRLIGNNLDSISAFRYNSKDYDVGQPTLSSDGKMLIFASNIPGGQGGSDIWYCIMTKGEWSAPVNFGAPVNSTASENFPYYHRSGKLFFASDRPGGIGKMDIYSTILTAGKWDDPVLLPEPINSGADDFSFVADKDLLTGYFVSDRMNSDDIYSFVSTILRKTKCDTMEENSYCYRFVEENSVKLDSVPFRYDWRFGDGQKASGVMVEHCFEKPGTYIVQLDVLNLVTNELSVNEKSDTLVVTQVEQAYFTGPDSIASGQRVMLDAGETNLPGWNIARYYWNFGDETIAVGPSVEKTFIKPGKYNVQLIVTDAPKQGEAARETCVSKNIKVFKKP